MPDEVVLPAAEGRHEAPELAAAPTAVPEPAPAERPIETPEAAALTQHPALHGYPEVEVAQRSADGSAGLSFRKVFVMAGLIPKDHPQHEANWVGTLQEAIHRGLHPKGKVQLVEHEVSEPDRRGNVNTTATYAVDVEPASTDTEAHTTVTPSSDVVHEPVRA